MTQDLVIRAERLQEKAGISKEKLHGHYQARSEGHWHYLGRRQKLATDSRWHQRV